jgi:Fe-S cluster biosynthesis and repair protein YggX
MIFRWSIWGANKEKSIELLKYSIRSFKYFFGNSHEYYVYTDDVTNLNKEISGIAFVRNFNENGESIFNINSKATWMKWCPGSRINIKETEIYIDSDVFLLRYPKEIDDFINNKKLKFCIMDEFNGQSWQHGAMARKAIDKTPFVNAGFFIQKSGCDITQDLLSEFEWWKQNVPINEQTHHDEQGALAIALTNHLINGELCILPKDKYVLIGPNENQEIKNLENITMFHAVYPDHPAFYKLKNYLDDLLKE